MSENVEKENDDEEYPINLWMVRFKSFLDVLLLGFTQKGSRHVINDLFQFFLGGIALAQNLTVWKHDGADSHVEQEAVLDILHRFESQIFIELYSSRVIFQK